MDSAKTVIASVRVVAARLVITFYGFAFFIDLPTSAERQIAGGQRAVSGVALADRLAEIIPRPENEGGAGCGPGKSCGDSDLFFRYETDLLERLGANHAPWL